MTENENVRQESEQVCLYCALWLCLGIFQKHPSLNNCDPAISLSDGAVKHSSVETLDNRDFFLEKFKFTYVVFT